jgi:translation initiation factor 2B subunit (eIF-2B alpha/beta/delta family)/ADP-ribose pyrophosphatase YjhB (NUDIX family)
MDETRVVTVVLRNGTDVLLLRRSDAVGSYRGKWGAVAGHVAPAPSEDAADADGPSTAAGADQSAGRGPDAAAREEIREETGVDPDALALVRRGDPFAVADADRGTRWLVHPYLFDCPTRAVTINEETTEYEWVPPTEILRRDTVPDLWRSYRAVAPGVETVRDDDTHGSAYISVRALEVLRDAAAEAGSYEQVAAAAADLLDARPGMVAVRNRVNRAMHEAADATPEAAEAAAHDAIDAALRADDEVAAAAAERVAGRRVFTLSRSGTVLDALRRGDPERVVVAESRPAREGVGVAEDLADAGIDVTLATDAAVPWLLADLDVEVVLVGADAVALDGRLVNKAGTRTAALAAAREGVPCYAVCAADKVLPEGDPPRPEEGDPGDVYDGDRDVTVRNPIFDVTPADLVTGVVTERGILDADGVREVAAELRALRDWRE